jgi:hypothetical protein
MKQTKGGFMIHHPPSKPKAKREFAKKSTRRPLSALLWYNAKNEPKGVEL